MGAILRAFTVLSLVYEFCSAQYAPISRWGQATALVEDIIFVIGGRTDLYNSYSYTSAPVNNDVLSLFLSSSFNISSPPWDYVAGCSNCSSSQAPAVVWHTLSAVNTSTLLLFGGDLGTTAPVPESADSAALVGISSAQTPVWYLEADSWADEPMRRMYHSSSSSGGKIYIVGGLKTDGSNNAYSDHYVFDPKTPSFTQLPSTNGPPDIYGHASIVLSNGWLIVFGGYCQSENTLLPFTTVWAMDTTQSTLGWATLSVSNASVPSPRRGFAATLLEGGQVVIHGGADAEMQTTLSDGWVLDTTRSPMVWSSIDTLSQLGPRRDHFAVGLGSQVLFGFGYANNGAAPAALELFDLPSASFVSTYTPSSSVTNPTSHTIPGPSPSRTGQASSPTGSSDPQHSGSGSGSGGASGTAGDDPPSSTGGANSGGSGSGGGSSGNGSSSGKPSAHSSHASTIALSTVFGVLGLIAGTTAVTWYVRRQLAQDRFHALRGSDNESSPDVLVAGREKALPHVVQNVKSKLGALVPGRPLPQQERRDMLADEDAVPWYNVRRDTSSGQSSSSSGAPHRHHGIGDSLSESLASLRSVGGTMLAYATGSRGLKSREASAGSRSTAWWEENSYTPVADDVGLINGAPVGRAARPRGGRQASEATIGTSYSHYENPFADYDVEETKAGGDIDLDIADHGFPSLSDPPPPPLANIKVPPTPVNVTRLSPLSEHPSVATISNPVTTSDSSLLTAFNAGPSSTDHSSGSAETSRSLRPRPSSILDANPSPTQPMRRSDSWWTRFAKTPLLDRRLSVGSRRDSPRPLDFRDPNPPPRLIPIEESTHTYPDSPPSRQESGHVRARLYSNTQHGRSASSLQTSKTADSEMIEKMGRTMDIAMNSTLTSHASGSGTDSQSYSDADAPQRQLSLSQSAMFPASGDDEVLNPVQSPMETTEAEASQSRLPALPGHPQVSPPKRLAAGGNVAARVEAFERRMSQQEDTAPLRIRKDRPSTYGVVPKPSLFVANPDQRRSDST
ncbi:hypothetical protein SCP_1200760 [Sparassis crispa]|uniref:Galactose oxidase n=1 Tax=Sparassis crispa TaxID=139825 RepID=A0A401H0B1_9APHY|nr:hypothetical protein SCP_1200760 [Sparassis crispa]GBE87851.1 hypothetical protein SCP_1200760 [Sparassis crispa]